MKSCVHLPSYTCKGDINTLVLHELVMPMMYCLTCSVQKPVILNLPLTLRLHLWVLALPFSVHLLRNAGSIEDEMKLLQNKKLTERQRAAAQLRFSEKVILQKTLDAVRRWSCFLHICMRGSCAHALCSGCCMYGRVSCRTRLDICLSSYNLRVL